MIYSPGINRTSEIPDKMEWRPNLLSIKQYYLLEEYNSKSLSFFLFFFTIDENIFCTIFFFSKSLHKIIVSRANKLREGTRSPSTYQPLQPLKRLNKFIKSATFFNFLHWERTCWKDKLMEEKDSKERTQIYGLQGLWTKA